MPGPYAQISGVMGQRMALFVLVLVGALLAAACSDPSTDSNPGAQTPLVFEVNPLVGTDLEGQTFPGAITPWGMASPSPHTRLTTAAELLGSDFLEGGLAFSGYGWGDPTIHGFGTAHLSGVGCPDLGGPVVVPFVGEPPGDFASAGSPYGDEKAHPGYYATYLERPQVHAEMSATPRTGVFRFRFDQLEAGAGILLDVANSLSIVYDGGAVKVVAPNEIEGYAKFGLFCGQPNQGRIHFVARVDAPVAETGVMVDGSPVARDEASGPVGAFMRFDQSFQGTVELAIGLSWVSIEGARANLDAEQVSLDEAVADAEQAWQTVLERVEVEGRAQDRRAFYTALYHLAIHPNLASDVDGGYLRFPQAEPAMGDPENPQYTVFSLWDTYRTVHPLLTLLYPERQLAMLHTMADMTALGAPPKWELWGDEVQMMVGDPAIIVVADSMAKGLSDFDAAAMFEVMFEAAQDPTHRPGVESYLEAGYIPMEEAGLALLGGVWGPAATTLEYAFADWALARIAEHLDQGARAEALDQRAIGYRTLFDEATGTLRPRMADGSFLEPYDPDAFVTDSSMGAGGAGFVEGTAWQYAFMTPHDMDGLISLHGGPDAFLERLESVFTEDRFTLFNEPDLAYPYLFTYVDGQAHQTQREVRKALTENFGDGPDGIEGNDDAGTMSAWFAFSAMGFYPATPGLAEYRIGSPLFERVTLHLSPTHHQGSTFVIEALGNAEGAPYVQSMTLNGEPLTTPVLPHAAVTAGGTLRLEMGSDPP